MQTSGDDLCIVGGGVIFSLSKKDLNLSLSIQKFSTCSTVFIDPYIEFDVDIKSGEEIEKFFVEWGVKVTQEPRL